MNTSQLYIAILLAPLSFFAGTAASAIGFAAWPLIVPVLIVGCGLDIHYSIIVSLLIDGANAAIMAGFGITKKNIDIKLALWLAFIACIFVIPGIYLNRPFVEGNREFFKGGIGLVTFILGLLFLVKGYRNAQKPPINVKENSPRPANQLVIKRVRRGLSYLGVAATGVLTGLIGIGGGMNYALLIMFFRPFNVRKAAATGMCTTAITALFAAITLWLRNPSSPPEQYSLALPAFLIGMSGMGAVIGGKIAYGISEQKIYYLVGTVVIVASLVVTVQKYLL